MKYEESFGSNNCNELYLLLFLSSKKSRNIIILSFAFFMVQELWPKGKISFKHGCVFPQIHNLNGLFQTKNVP